MRPLVPRLTAWWYVLSAACVADAALWAGSSGGWHAGYGWAFPPLALAAACACALALARHVDRRVMGTPRPPHPACRRAGLILLSPFRLPPVPPGTLPRLPAGTQLTVAAGPGYRREAWLPVRPGVWIARAGEPTEDLTAEPVTAAQLRARLAARAR